MHEVLITPCSSFVRLTDRPDMTVAADWDVKQQIIKLFVGIQHVSYPPFEPQHEITNNVVCATNKASDQPAHTRSLIRVFATRLNIS